MTTGFVHVRFCEIPRIYDLFFGPGVHCQPRRVIDRGAPKQIEHLARADMGVWDEAGNNVGTHFREIPPPMKGVYRSFSVSQMNTVLRTFVRDPDRYQARCFWSSPKDYVVAVPEIAWVARQLMTHGGREGWQIGARLCR